MKSRNCTWLIAFMALPWLTFRCIAGAGSVDPTFNVTANNTVYSLLTQPDGKILMGGAFTQVNGTNKNGMTRLFPDGTLDTYTNPLAGGAIVYAMLRQPDGKILIGGTFNTLGQNRNNIARLNVDGSLDGTFSNTIPTYPVFALALQSDGKILVGGQFTFIGNSNRYYVGRLNTDGSLDNAFNTGTIAGSPVYAIAAQADGKTLIGGSFNSFSTYQFSRQNLARLLSDGTPDLTFLENANSPVQVLLTQPDGKFVVGGAFTAITAASTTYPRNKLARLNVDGSMDGGLTSATGPNGTIYSLAEDTNNNIYVGGQFTTYNNVTRGGIARLFSDGTLDSNFNKNPTNLAPPLVRSMALQSDGRLLVGGQFNSFNGVARTNLVRLYGDNYPAEIVTQPQSRNAVVGTNVSFSVNVSNPTPVGYQWRKNGADIPGANYNQYSLSNVQLADAGNYSVFVGNGFGGTTSSNALLQVGTPPSITQQPVDVTVTQGQNASFTAAATGNPLNLYWRFLGTNIDGATNTTFYLTNVAGSMAGAYSFVASNFLGSVTSAPAILNVLYPPSITSDPVSQFVAVGGTATFRVGALGNPLYYQWLKDGIIIPGAISGVHSRSNLVFSDAGGYSVIVYNQFSSVTSAVASLVVSDPPLIMLQPVNQTDNLAGAAAFSVKVSGGLPLTYQWLFNGLPLTNQNSTNLSLTNLQINNIGYYSLAATNPFGGTVSSNAVLALNGYPFNLYYRLAAYYPFSGNAADATGNGNNGQPNGALLTTDRFGKTNSAYQFNGAQNIQFTNVPMTQTDNWTMCTWLSLDSLSQYGIAIGLGYVNTNSFSYDGMELGVWDGLYTPGQLLSASINGNSAGGNYYFYPTNQWFHALMVRDTGTIYFYVNGIPTYASTTLAPSTPTSFTIGSETASHYFQGKLDDIRLYNRALNSNDIYQLYLFESGLPYITQQPVSQVVLTGSTAGFGVQAGGSPPLFYQWVYSNSIIPNATNSTFSLNSVQPSQSGPYQVVVTNNFGSITSSVANLLVGSAPQAVQYHYTNSNKSFALQMSGTPGFNYVLQSTTNLMPPVLWQNVATNPADSNGIWSYLDTNTSSTKAKFFRISSP